MPHLNNKAEAAQLVEWCSVLTAYLAAIDRYWNCQAVCINHLFLPTHAQFLPQDSFTAAFPPCWKQHQEYWSTILNCRFRKWKTMMPNLYFLVSNQAGSGFVEKVNKSYSILAEHKLLQWGSVLCADKKTTSSKKFNTQRLEAAWPARLSWCCGPPWPHFQYQARYKWSALLADCRCWNHTPGKVEDDRKSQSACAESGGLPTQPLTATLDLILFFWGGWEEEGSIIWKEFIAFLWHTPSCEEWLHRQFFL